jgi:hypothetical protein
VKAMQITNLERQVIERFLQDTELQPLRRFANSEKISVVARDFTGPGFLTHIEPSDEVKLFADAVTLRWGNVGARLNSSKIETGYLVYVDNGYLTTLEGYTYGEDWPEQISSIELYELKLGTELGQG